MRGCVVGAGLKPGPYIDGERERYCYDPSAACCNGSSTPVGMTWSVCWSGLGLV